MILVGVICFAIGMLAGISMTRWAYQPLDALYEESEREGLEALKTIYEMKRREATQ